MKRHKDTPPEPQDFTKLKAGDTVKIKGGGFANVTIEPYQLEVFEPWCVGVNTTLHPIRLDRIERKL